MTAIGQALPAVLVTAEDVAAGKPHPEGYQQAARRLGVDPRRTVVIEDTDSGVKAGRAAGATVIGLRTTYPLARGLRGRRLMTSGPFAWSRNPRPREMN